MAQELIDSLSVLEKQLMSIPSFEFLNLGNPLNFYIRENNLSLIQILLNEKKCPILSHNCIFLTDSFSVFEYLLLNHIDLEKTNFDDPNINEVHKKWIMMLTCTKRLKYSYNPNKKTGMYEIPMWRCIVSSRIKAYLKDFCVYKGVNFTEQINIDALDKIGTTWLHSAFYLHPEILELIPNPWAKVNGMVPSQFRRKIYDNLPPLHLNSNLSGNSGENSGEISSEREVAKTLLIKKREQMLRNIQIVSDYESCYDDINFGLIIRSSETMANRNIEYKKEIVELRRELKQKAEEILRLKTSLKDIKIRITQEIKEKIKDDLKDDVIMEMIEDTILTIKDDMKQKKRKSLKRKRETQCSSTLSSSQNSRDDLCENLSKDSVERKIRKKISDSKLSLDSKIKEKIEKAGSKLDSKFGSKFDSDNEDIFPLSQLLSPEL